MVFLSIEKVPSARFSLSHNTPGATHDMGGWGEKKIEFFFQKIKTKLEFKRRNFISSQCDCRVGGCIRKSD